jgi:hypothetical protein
MAAPIITLGDLNKADNPWIQLHPFKIEVNRCQQLLECCLLESDFSDDEVVLELRELRVLVYKIEMVLVL